MSLVVALGQLEHDPRARRALVRNRQRDQVRGALDARGGLFGTVWGIMEAFVRIGVEKSASLPVVAPAIGEALIATAFGLVAAIPATIAFNYVDKRIGDLLDELGASSEVWVETLIADPSDARGRG